MKYKAIIFDMDGTIVQTEDLWLYSNELLLKHYGIEYTDELRREIEPRVQGLSGHKSSQIIKDIAGIDRPIEQIMQDQTNIAHGLYHDEIKFIDGFIDFHAKVVAHGLKHGIATNACDKTVALTDKVLNLRQFFGKHIYGVSCVGNVCKPDPDIFLHAAEKLQVDPCDCVVIEDSAHGVNAALKAGMYCIGIKTSKDLRQIEKAHRAIGSYCELDPLHLQKN
jgi:HAD superfamily hydrolase (TIGR01509 family)